MRHPTCSAALVPSLLTGTIRAITAALLGTIIAVVIGGCAGTPPPVTYARAYPALKQTRTLNIQVFRSNQNVELTNTTAHAFGPATLWLNARFSRPIDGLAVGQTVRVPLIEFRDEYADPFRGGGFFAAEIPERLVLAQIESPLTDGKSELLGLVVVGGDDE